MIRGCKIRIAKAPDAFIRSIRALGFRSDDEAVLGAGFQPGGGILLGVFGKGLDDFTRGIIADVFGVFTYTDDLAVAIAFCPAQVGCGGGDGIHIKV